MMDWRGLIKTCETSGVVWRLRKVHARFIRFVSDWSGFTLIDTVNPFRGAVGNDVDIITASTDSDALSQARLV